MMTYDEMILDPRRNVNERYYREGGDQITFFPPAGVNFKKLGTIYQFKILTRTMAVI